jgi:hypothetical protein
VQEVWEFHRFYAAPVSAIDLSVILTRTAEVSSVAELPRFTERATAWPYGAVKRPKSFIMVKR